MFCFTEIKECFIRKPIIEALSTANYFTDLLPTNLTSCRVMISFSHIVFSHLLLLRMHTSGMKLLLELNYQLYRFPAEYSIRRISRTITLLFNPFFTATQFSFLFVGTFSQGFTKLCIFHFTVRC